MARFTLTKDQFEDLREKLNDNDEHLRPDYSGRGMYGATCLAYDTDDRSPAKFQLQLAKVLAPDYFGEEEPDMDAIEEMMDEIGSPSSDSMGLGVVFYYRGIQVEGHAQGSRF